MKSPNPLKKKTPIKKQISALFLAVMLVLTAVPAVPVTVRAENYQFITSIRLDSSEEGYNRLVDDGYSVMGLGLNSGVSDDEQVWIGLQLNEGTPVTNVIIMPYGGDSYDTEDGTRYLSAGYVDVDEGSGSGKGCVYYTIDPDAGEPLVGLDILKSDPDSEKELYAITNDGAEVVRTPDGAPADLETNRDAMPMYLAMIRDGLVRPYICELEAVSGEDRVDAVYQAASYGYNYYVEGDIDDADDTYTILAYNRTADPKDAVTNIAAITENLVDLLVEGQIKPSDIENAAALHSNETEESQPEEPENGPEEELPNESEESEEAEPSEEPEDTGETEEPDESADTEESDETEEPEETEESDEIVDEETEEAEEEYEGLAESEYEEEETDEFLEEETSEEEYDEEYPEEEDEYEQEEPSEEETEEASVEEQTEPEEQQPEETAESEETVESEETDKTEESLDGEALDLSGVRYERVPGDPVGSDTPFYLYTTKDSRAGNPISMIYAGGDAESTESLFGLWAYGYFSAKGTSRAFSYVINEDALEELRSDFTVCVKIPVTQIGGTVEEIPDSEYVKLETEETFLPLSFLTRKEGLPEGRITLNGLRGAEQSAPFMEEAEETEEKLNSSAFGDKSSVILIGGGMIALAAAAFGIYKAGKRRSKKEPKAKKKDAGKRRDRK